MIAYAVCHPGPDLALQENTVKDMIGTVENTGIRPLDETDVGINYIYTA